MVMRKLLSLLFMGLVLAPIPIGVAEGYTAGTIAGMVGFLHAWVGFLYVGICMPVSSSDALKIFFLWIPIVLSERACDWIMLRKKGAEE